MVAAANTEVHVTWVARCGCLYCKWQTPCTIKGLAIWNCFLCTTTANRSWILCQFTNNHFVFYQSPDTHIHINFVWNVAHVSFWLFGLWFLRGNSAKAKVHLSIKFAPREITHHTVYSYCCLQLEWPLICHVKVCAWYVDMDVINDLNYCVCWSSNIYL